MPHDTKGKEKFNMQDEQNNNQSNAMPSLAECLDRLKATIADVVCHPELSKEAADFLVSFCKVIADQAGKDAKARP